MNFRKISKLDLFKIILFTIFQVVMTIMFLCIIPTVILIRGYILSNKNNNLEYLIKYAKKSKIYTIATCIIMIILTVHDRYLDITYAPTDMSYIINEMTILFFIVTYFLLIQFFFIKIIEKNKIVILNDKIDDIKIFNRENFKSYSIADELLKWNELKSRGLISEEEFQKAKEKIIEK